MSKRLIYTVCCGDEKYLQLLEMLIESYKLYAGPPDNTDLLVICTSELKDQIQNIISRFDLQADVWCLSNINCKLDAGCARLQIFNYRYIDQYDQLLYLDADVIITRNLSFMLNIDTRGKLLAKKESSTANDTHGASFFPPGYKHRDGFNSGVLLFSNNPDMKLLFNRILDHVNKHKQSGLPHSHGGCHDQPFINYNTITCGLDNINTIDTIWNPKQWPVPGRPQTATTHFMGGGYGKMGTENKLKRMKKFLHILKKFYKDI